MISGSTGEMRQLQGKPGAVPRPGTVGDEMTLGNAEAVAALRAVAARLRAEAAALDEKADLLERVESDWTASREGHTPAMSSNIAGEPLETLGHVWTSEAAGAYIASIEEQERKLNDPEYDIDVVAGSKRIGEALGRLKDHYGNVLDIQDVAVAFLDAGVCRSNAATRKVRVSRVKTKVYEYVKKSPEWQRVRENTIQCVGIDVERTIGDSLDANAPGIGA